MSANKNFSRTDSYETSTVTCNTCGDAYTWSGIDDGLDKWEYAHMSCVKAITFTLPETTSMKTVAKMWPPHIGEKKPIYMVPGLVLGCAIYSDHPSVALLGWPHGGEFVPHDKTVKIYLKDHRHVFVAAVEVPVVRPADPSAWPGWLFLTLDCIPSLRDAIIKTRFEQPHGRGILNPNSVRAVYVGGLRPDDPPGAQL